MNSEFIPEIGTALRLMLLSIKGIVETLVGKIIFMENHSFLNPYVV